MKTPHGNTKEKTVLINAALRQCFPASELVALVTAGKITNDEACRAWNSRGGYFNLHDCAEDESAYQKFHDI